jgi:hypothetical protein
MGWADLYNGSSRDHASKAVDKYGKCNYHGMLPGEYCTDNWAKSVNFRNNH